MVNDSQLNIDDIEREEALLRERLADLAEIKRLLIKLGRTLAGVSTPSPVPAAPPLIKETSSEKTETASATVNRPAFDGTVKGLVDVYRSDDRSPYHNLRPRVRVHYDSILNRLVAEIGLLRISEINKDRIMRIYEGWMAGGKVAMAYALVGRLRLILSFGMTELDDPQCTRLSTIMHTLKFKLPRKRAERLTAGHVVAIREQAHDLDWHSIALAQALQFELKLRQADVIGEWVQLTDPTDSDIVVGHEKWIRGLRWEQIDQDLVLRHTATDYPNKPRSIVADLKQCPMIMEELDWFTVRPTKGPMILCEYKSTPTDKPYTTTEFRRKWRIVANKAGIPKNIRNSDGFRAEDLKHKPEVATTSTEGRLH
jgi:hypothetical protein